MAKRWPCLILPQFCKTLIHVKMESEELDEDGAPIVTCDWKGKCNYQDKAKRVFTQEQKIVQITGICMIPGDIVPEQAVISSGEVIIFDVKREIAQGSKLRNPDGSVNYTLLELI